MVSQDKDIGISGNMQKRQTQQRWLSEIKSKQAICGHKLFKLNLLHFRRVFTPVMVLPGNLNMLVDYLYGFIQILPEERCTQRRMLCNYVLPGSAESIKIKRTLYAINSLL